MGIKKKTKRLKGRKILITAGPTRENIDPVRYISNHSSGKMGYALAETCAEEGAEVILVSGPTSLTTHHPAIQRIDVTTAAEMSAASLEQFPQCDAGIMTAAVADYAPMETSGKKVKRTKDNLLIELEPTSDIAAGLGKQKKKGQVLVGFALETDNEVTNARKKMSSKNFDFIVLNSLRDKGAGFGHDTNKITIIDRDNNIRNFELKSKKEVASDIINKLLEYVS